MLSGGIGPHREADVSAWVLARRGQKDPADPRRPQAWFIEKERSPSGQLADSLCVLLTGKECPWRCVMCDLWRHTLSSPTPAGAIPAQLDYVLARVNSIPEQVKLYNSGSFFDPAAVPVADYPGLAARLRFARRTVVECHPRLVGSKVLRFRELLRGSLEVALGLETADPATLARLNKRFTLADFARAAEFLHRARVGLRVFVLVSPPFCQPAEAVQMAVQSAEYAFNCGAGAVTLIPTRPGNGALDDLQRRGQFTPPSLRSLESALQAALSLHRGRVFADLWDLEKFSACPSCFAARRSRLELMNFHQQIPPPVSCAQCEAPSAHYS